MKISALVGGLVLVFSVISFADSSLVLNCALPMSMVDGGTLIGAEARQINLNLNLDGTPQTVRIMGGVAGDAHFTPTNIPLNADANSRWVFNAPDGLSMVVVNQPAAGQSISQAVIVSVGGKVVELCSR